MYHHFQPSHAGKFGLGQATTNAIRLLHPGFFQLCFKPFIYNEEPMLRLVQRYQYAPQLPLLGIVYEHDMV